jgi:hypothetical protein
MKIKKITLPRPEFLIKKRGRAYRFYQPYDWRLTGVELKIDGRVIGMVARTDLTRRGAGYMLWLNTCIGNKAYIATLPSSRAAIERAVEIYADNAPCHNDRICDCAARWGGERFYPGPRWKTTTNCPQKC